MTEPAEIMALIEDYGSESRWVGHYHALGEAEFEGMAKAEVERLFTEIKDCIDSLCKIDAG